MPSKVVPTSPGASSTSRLFTESPRPTGLPASAEGPIAAQEEHGGAPAMSYVAPWRNTETSASPNGEEGRSAGWGTGGLGASTETPGLHRILLRPLPAISPHSSPRRSADTSRRSNGNEAPGNESGADEAVEPKEVPSVEVKEAPSVEVPVSHPAVGSAALPAGAENGDSDGVDSESQRRLHVSLKTVGKLRSSIRRQLPSYAEEHDEDISAEVNSLSQIITADDSEELPRFILSHDSMAKLIWDIVMMTLIVFSSFVNPLQIGFDLKTTGALFVIEALVDFIFMFDVGLTFRTSVEDDATKETITSARKISARYLKGWFVLDLLSSLPVTLVSSFFDFTNVQKFFIGFKLLRTLKLHQLSVIITAVLKRFEDRDFNPSVFRIYIFVLAFILVVHFIACGYWAVSRLTDPHFEGNWTPDDEYLDADLPLKYARALYFSLVITYGNDLKPENSTEFVFSNICLTLALLTNAVIIGSATNLLSNVDAGALARKSKMDGVNGYLRGRKVPLRLQKKIRSFFEYLWESGYDGYSSGLFEEMPEKLKLQLNVALKKQLIEKVPLFKTCSPAGIIALVQNLVPSIILPGDLIVRQGEQARSMFFISRGTVRVFVTHEGSCGDETRSEHYIISLGAGSFFGEVALIEQAHVRTANIRAETFTELQVLDGDDFRSLSEVFPEFKAAVKTISESRVKASDALASLKKRGKFVGTDARSMRERPNSGSASSPASRKFKGVAAAAAGRGPQRNLPRLAQVVDRLAEVGRWGRGRVSLERAMGRSVPASMMGATSPQSPQSNRGEGRFSFIASPRSTDGAPRSVYEATVAHEEKISHEAAMRVARGGGIHRDTLMATNTS